MSLVWHIVRKDLRRMAGPLALWLVLAAGQVWVLFALDSQPAFDAAAFEGKRYFVATCGGIIMGLGFILAAWLVMEDNLVSTAAFWRTRPVHGSRLLAAKVLGALLMFSVLPVGVLTPVWLGCGFSFREIAHAAWELASAQALCSLAAFALAGITGTTGQFLARLTGAAILLPLYLGYVLGNFHGYKDGFSSTVSETRSVIVLGLVLLTAAVMVVHQFLTRRMLRTCLLFAGGLALMAVGGCWWPWDTLVRFRPQPVASAGQGTPIALVPLQVEANFNSAIGDFVPVQLAGRVAGVAPGGHVRVDEVFGAWTDGRPGPRLKGLAANRQPPADVVRQAAGLSSPAATETAWAVVGRESREILEQAQAGRVKLGGTVRATVLRGIVLGELPLRAGALLEVGSSSTRIGAVREVDGNLVVLLEERDAWLKADAGPYANSYDPVRSRMRPAADGFIVLNRARKIDLMPVVAEIGTLKANSIMVGRRSLVIAPPGEGDDWLEGAVLMKVRFVSETEITQALPR